MNGFACFAVALAAVVASALGSPTPRADTGNDVVNTAAYDGPQHHQQHAPTVREDELMRKLNAKCAAKDASSCAMLKLVAYVDKLMKKNSLEIGELVEIAKRDGPEPEPEAPEQSPRPHSARAYTDESAFGELMADKLWTYVRSRSLKIRVLPEADFVVSASPARDGSLDFGLSFRSGKDLESGRGKNKNMGPMMAAMMMKMGMLKVLAFKVLALLVGKALFLSKLAFLLATIIGLKKLFSQQKHITYEVVAHPHHEAHSSDSYSSAGWGRSSSEAAHNMAYSSQAQ